MIIKGLNRPAAEKSPGKSDLLQNDCLTEFSDITTSVKIDEKYAGQCPARNTPLSMHLKYMLRFVWHGILFCVILLFTIQAKYMIFDRYNIPSSYSEKQNLRYQLIGTLNESINNQKYLFELLFNYTIIRRSEMLQVSSKGCNFKNVE